MAGGGNITDQASGARASLAGWAESPLGQEVLGKEIEVLTQMVPTGFYRASLQYGGLPIGLGSGPGTGPMEGINADIRVVIDPDIANAQPAPSVSFVRSQPEAVPFAQGSIDLALMPHTLDYCDDPLLALREVSQVLVPEGVLALTGFNALSAWGARAALARWSKLAPWSWRYHRVRTVQDWLSLLGFELVAGTMLDYRPPLNNLATRRKLEFLEAMGDRWWPGLGGVYVLVVRKRVYGQTLVPSKAHRLKRWIGGWSPASASKAPMNKAR